MTDKNHISETDTEDEPAQTHNEIAISWGDVQIAFGGDQTPQEIEDQLLIVLKRLKKLLNGDKHHDASFVLPDPNPP